MGWLRPELRERQHNTGRSKKGRWAVSPDLLWRQTSKKQRNPSEMSYLNQRCWFEMTLSSWNGICTRMYIIRMWYYAYMPVSYVYIYICYAYDNIYVANRIFNTTSCSTLYEQIQYSTTQLGGLEGYSISRGWDCHLDVHARNLNCSPWDLQTPRRMGQTLRFDGWGFTSFVSKQRCDKPIFHRGFWFLTHPPQCLCDSARCKKTSKVGSGLSARYILYIDLTDLSCWFYQINAQILPNQCHFDTSDTSDTSAGKGQNMSEGSLQAAFPHCLQVVVLFPPISWHPAMGGARAVSELLWQLRGAAVGRWKHREDHRHLLNIRWFRYI